MFDVCHIHLLLTTRPVSKWSFTDFSMNLIDCNSIMIFIVVSRCNFWCEMIRYHILYCSYSQPVVVLLQVFHFLQCYHLFLMWKVVLARRGSSYVCSSAITETFLCLYRRLLESVSKPHCIHFSALLKYLSLVVFPF